jgi:glycosyltransferase involved in cell wall biosynthesis
MNIAINTRFLLSRKMEGFGWFTYEVVKRMVEHHPEHQFYFFFDRAYDEKFVFADNIIPVVLHPQARHPILFKIWFDFSVTKALKKYNIDLFFSPDGYLSLKTNTKQIAVIHDLNFEHFPKDIPKAARMYLKKYFPLFADKANHIITVSNFSKKDIINTYGVNANKITVAYNGGNEAYHPIGKKEQNEVKKTLTGGHDYFVYVGALHARKNIKRMFEAFDLFKLKTNSKTKLVVVGEELWKTDKSFKSHHLKYKQDVIYTGYLPINKLTNIVGAAKALVLVSYFEGFGIPLVEAMRCGVPVITSDTSATAEVYGDAGLLVNPYHIESISEKFELLDKDSELRVQLSENALKRSKNFTWDMSADIIWNKIEELLTN